MFEDKTVEGIKTRMLGRLTTDLQTREGSFTNDVISAAAAALSDGSHTITITATDAAGKTSTMTRTVTLDTSVPKVASAAITPNPVDAGATMIISVVITE